ncbi:MAG: hypothetical protein ACOYMS_04305 [Terrimicrobiaceae bacterium]
MCNAFSQNGRDVRPGQRATVRVKATGEVFDQAVFAGCARHESRGWWKRQGASEAILDATRFAEKNKSTGVFTWDDIPAGQAIEALLEPQPDGKDYRLLKVVTREATPEELARFGNNRVPVLAASDVALP